MTKTIPHTIRFAPADKQALQALADIHEHGFQTEVSLAIKRYLRNNEVLLFCDALACRLESLLPEDRQTMMAKIADIIDSE